jgi:hypothetical protein
MARCPHCGEPVADRQETCYACGHKVRARGYKAEHHVNPLVFVAAGLVVVLVLGGLWMIRNNAAKKQAAQVAEEEVLRAQDSTRRANRDWLDAERVAKEDNEVRALAVELDDMEGRLKSVRLRVAANPSPRQESIIRTAERQLALLREAAIVLGVLPEGERQAKRDSIQAGERRVEDLTKELGSTE